MTNLIIFGQVEIDNGIVKLTLMNPSGLITSIGYKGVDNVLEYRNAEGRRGLVQPLPNVKIHEKYS